MKKILWDIFATKKTCQAKSFMLEAISLILFTEKGEPSGTGKFVQREEQLYYGKRSNLF